MAAPALTAASSLAVLALGGAANLAASNKPLQARMWMPRGGFIGVVNGGGPKTATQAPPAAPAAPDAAPAPAAPGKKIHPIGGRTDKPAPPTPFGKFPRHRPSKLPGPPGPFNPSKGP